MSSENYPVDRPELADILAAHEYALCLSENIMEVHGKGRSESKALSREAFWENDANEKCRLRSIMRNTHVSTEIVTLYELTVWYPESKRIKEIYRFSTLATMVLQYDENEEEMEVYDAKEKSERVIVMLLSSGFKFNTAIESDFFEIAANYHLDTDRLEDIQHRLGAQGIFGQGGCLEEMTSSIQGEEPLVTKADVEKVAKSYLYKAS